MTFMKTFWAALLAFIVANILIIIITYMLFAGMIAMVVSVTPPMVGDDSILKIDLTEEISDSPAGSPIKNIGLSGVTFDNSNTILQAITALEKAAYDDRIRGVYINTTMGVSSSMSCMEELRSAILEFKKSSGKFVVSYGDQYTQLGYYLSSVADKVYINPKGSISWQGLASSVMFYKGALDKLGVDAQIIRHGTFKAAVEPFMLDRMSPENRLQMSTFTNTIWGTMLEGVAQARGIDSAALSNYATELSLMSKTESALKYGFVDGMIYEDQMMSILTRLSLGQEDLETAERAVISGSGELEQEWVEIEKKEEQRVEEDSVGESVADEMEVVVEKKSSRKKQKQVDALVDKEPTFVTLKDYIFDGKFISENRSKNRIAIIYADGDIIDGKSTRGSIGGATMAAKIAQVRKDDRVKALVLRINSPGGSALASEVIWREMEKTKQQMPVIVSMGSMAASGGYYIAAPADVILANKTTVTGSIGVLGILFNVSKGLKEKLGITVDVVRTNPSADAGSPYRSLSANEREVIQQSVEQVYETFVGHVADGRNLSKEYVDQIGGGRIWSGVSALENGLIDGYGGIKDAISLAADRAGVAGDFRLWEVVDAEDNINMLLRALGGGIKSWAIQNELGEMFYHYNQINNMISQKGGVQARIPYAIEIQ